MYLLFYTIRGDLLKKLKDLIKNKKFSNILIETTGFAHPTPIYCTNIFY
jgi:G3E family GTPase